MKKILTIACLLLSGIAHAQESYYKPLGTSTSYSASSSLPVWYQCLQKYWFYRYRLVNDFTYIGSNPGESLIAYRRIKGDVNGGTMSGAPGNGANCLDFAADQTIDLAHYMGMLAVEYKLLKNNNMNTDRTLYEIHYAQNAFDRLRYNSEFYYNHMNDVSGAGYPPSTEAPLDFTLGPTYTVSSGFFVRDDVPLWNFLSNNNTINQSHYQHFNRPYLVNSFTCSTSCIPNSYSLSISSWTCPSGTINNPDGSPSSLLKSVNNCDRAWGGAFWGYTGPNPPGSTYYPYGATWIPGSTTTYPNCESQDQLSDVFVGEALLSKYLDPSDPTALLYRERAQDALFEVVDWVSHPCGAPTPTPFYSIPAPAPTGGSYTTSCAKNSCSTSGIIMPFAVPMAAAANMYADHTSVTAGYMGLLDGPTSGIGSILGAPYWWMFEFYQTIEPYCSHVNGATGLEEIEFVDDYAAFANDWSKLKMYGYGLIPGSFYYAYSPVWLLDYAYFLANTDSHAATFSTLKNHAINDYHGTLHLPIIWQLNNTDQDSDPGWHAANIYIDSLLSAAPCCGPWNYEASQFNNWARYGSGDNYWNYPSSFGYTAYPAIGSPPLDAISMWSGNDLLSDPEHRQGNNCYYPNDQGYDCDFNGLDYMYLFSLYALERGNNYLQGIMNSYFDDNFNVPFPDSHGYGSTTNKLKLNFLEYMRYTGTISPGAWIDFRGAQKIDLLPGEHIPQGSTVMIHIKDYNCSGGDLGDGPYNFAELNPSPADYRTRDSSGVVDTGWRQIVYLPNGGGFIPENIPPADPNDRIVDSFLNAPGVKDSLGKFFKYMMVNSTQDSNMLSAIKDFMGWTDDSLAAYTIPMPDSITVKIFPNPTNSISYLSYQISTPKNISIKLLNNLGQDLSYLIEHYDAEEQPGNYKLLINSDKLTPGIYYVVIQAGAKIVSNTLSVIN